MYLVKKENIYLVIQMSSLRLEMMSLKGMELA